MITDGDDPARPDSGVPAAARFEQTAAALRSDGGSADVDAAGSELAAEFGDATLVLLEAMDSLVGCVPAAAFDNALVISPSQPGRVEAAIERRGGDPGQCGHVPVTGSPVSYDGPLWVSSPVDPSDLTGISVRVSQAMEYVKPGEGWLLWEDLQFLLLYADPSNVYRLTSQVLDRARGGDAATVVGLNAAAAEERTVARFAGLFDHYADLR
ncbi:DUF7504 family protein [Halobaculum sp. D14]|uniref:DUF7504 family protein n=1 Tax=Halobaculum sp. D14 TaxID=3421642 RepID=UPI003EC05C15